MLLTTTQSPPRSRTQTSTQGRNPHTTRSPEIPTTAEIFTQDRSRHRLAHSLAIPTVEVTSVTGTGTTAATRPGPGRRQEAAVEAATARVMIATEAAGAAGAATARVMTATEAAAVGAATGQVTTATDRTEEGALDPTPMDISMVETVTIPMATRKAAWWRKSCLPLSPWWWSHWWVPQPPTSSATGEETASEPTYQRTSEDVGVPWGNLSLDHGSAAHASVESLLRPWPRSPP